MRINQTFERKMGHFKKFVTSVFDDDKRQSLTVSVSYYSVLHLHLSLSRIPKPNVYFQTQVSGLGFPTLKNRGQLRQADDVYDMYMRENCVKMHL